jgi:FkbM family methyltransferase
MSCGRFPKDSNAMKAMIRQLGRLVIPKRYRPGVRKWILSLFGMSADPSSPLFSAVYCGDKRILAYHPRTDFMYLDGTDLSITPRVITNNYERHVTKALETLVLPGFVVVECGANQGFHTLSMASMVSPGGRILAFEPDPRSLAVLRDNIRSHYLDSVVTVIPKAACNENQPLFFYCARSGGQSSLFPLRADEGPWASCYSSEQDSRIEVEGATIASVLAEHGLVPDLVRLDVEGAEPMALEGMWEHLENLLDIIVMFEYNPWCIRQGKQTTPEAFIKRLCSIGMQFWRIARDGELVPSEPQEILGIRDFFTVDDFVACRSPKLLQRSL